MPGDGSGRQNIFHTRTHTQTHQHGTAGAEPAPARRMRLVCLDKWHDKIPGPLNNFTKDSAILQSFTDLTLLTLAEVYIDEVVLTIHVACPGCPWLAREHVSDQGHRCRQWQTTICVAVGQCPEGAKMGAPSPSVSKPGTNMVAVIFGLVYRVVRRYVCTVAGRSKWTH